MAELKKSRYRIVALCGSPHKDGNTATLLHMLLSLLPTTSHIIYYAYELSVHPCIGCGYCSNEFACIYHDAMDELYTALMDAEVLIVAFPLYFTHLPSPLKAIIDRCQIFWEYYRRTKVSNVSRLAIALILGGSEYERMFEPSIITLRHYFNSLRFSFDEENYCLLPNINTKDDINTELVRAKIEKIAKCILLHLSRHDGALEGI